METKDMDKLAEPQAAYWTSGQGEYTLDDYYALPDERRVELIDGVIYDMASPTPSHQIINAEIWRQLAEHIRKKQGGCEVLMSPLDVQLDCDNKTMVQPDVLIVCDRNKIVKSGICGVPDFVAEVLSDSTKNKDMTIKLGKYMNAGVREYWIIDEDKRRVIVYDFAKEIFAEIYGFDARIPVGIFDGECQVDFAEIYDRVKFLYEE